MTTSVSAAWLFAYLDPGSGSLLFQALIAGFLGAAVALREWRHRVGGAISRLFRGRRRAPNDGAAPTDDAAGPGEPPSSS